MQSKVLYRTLIRAYRYASNMRHFCILQPYDARILPILRHGGTTNLSRYTLRVDQTLLDKLGYIAE